MWCWSNAPGGPGPEAWKGFADRTDVDTVRVLATVLVQAEQLGTSVTKTLRVHSETLRTKRRQYVEEQAAKTSVKLVFPLVFFIFPSLFSGYSGHLRRLSSWRNHSRRISY